MPWSQKNHEDMLIILEDILILIMRTCYFQEEFIWSFKRGKLDHEDMLIKRRTCLILHYEDKLIMTTCWSRGDSELIWSSIMRTSLSWGHADHENSFDHPLWGQVDHEDMLIMRRTYLIGHHEDRLIIKTLDQTSWGYVDGGGECKCIILGLRRSVLYHFVKYSGEQNCIHPHYFFFCKNNKNFQD